MSLQHRLTAKPRLLREYSTQSWMYMPAWSPSSRAGGMGKARKTEDRPEPEQLAPTPSRGWLWCVDSDRSQRPVMQDGCETSVPPGSCCTTKATPIGCQHHGCAPRASCMYGEWASSLLMVAGNVSTPLSSPISSHLPPRLWVLLACHGCYRPGPIGSMGQRCSDLLHSRQPTSTTLYWPDM